MQNDKRESEGALLHRIIDILYDSEKTLNQISQESFLPIGRVQLLVRDMISRGYLRQRSDGFQQLFSLEKEGSRMIRWVEMPVEGGWIALTLDGREVLATMGVNGTENTTSLTVKGYHLMQSRLNGNNGDRRRYSIKVGIIPTESREEVLRKLRDVLPRELSAVSVNFE